MLSLNLKGHNRWVILTRRFAWKIPSLRSWRDFLFGLLNNMNEAAESKMTGRCPIVWSAPGGFLVIMPRLQLMTEEEFWEFDSGAFALAHSLNAEHKADSFGYLNGEIVAVDYGW